MIERLLNAHGIIGGGLKGSDKQSLIDLANDAEANNNTIKTDVANKLKALNPALTITTTSSWADIKAAIDVLTNSAAGAAAGDILSGKEAFVNGAKVAGTLVKGATAAVDDTLIAANCQTQSTFNALGFPASTQKRVTVRVAGTYRAAASIYTNNAANGAQVRIWKNGAIFCTLQTFQTSPALVTYDIPCSVGDLIEASVGNTVNGYTATMQYFRLKSTTAVTVDWDSAT